MQTASEDGRPISICPAAWPKDTAVAVTLLQNYAKHLASCGVQIALCKYHEELANLPQMFSEPTGVLLLAFLNDEPAGCVAVKGREDQPATCDLKRLWVEWHAQGRGIGRHLARSAIAWARDHGAASLMLDTVPAAMPQAVALYRSLGFEVTDRHNENDVPGLQFLRLDLHGMPDAWCFRGASQA